MSLTTGTQEELLDVLRDEWHSGEAPSDWQESFSRLTDEWRAVEWQSGGRTLMSALGLQYLNRPAFHAASLLAVSSGDGPWS